MKVYSAEEIADRLPYRKLVVALRATFEQNVHAPLRVFHEIGSGDGGPPASFGLMPAWVPGQLILTKLITIVPGNDRLNLPTIHAQVVLFDGRTGQPLAVLDGTEVTRRRTAATSALAATFLARRDAAELLVVGTGAQALHQAAAYADTIPLERIRIWGRSTEKALRLVTTLRELRGRDLSLKSIEISRAEDLETATRTADVISCVTSSQRPVINGAWLRPGAFLDLVGSHKPDHRECDDVAIQRSTVFVDTLQGALSEAGDILIPLKNSTILPTAITGDLHQLCRAEVAGRSSAEEITLFKSVGSAVEDYGAAALVVDAQTPGSL